MRPKLPGFGLRRLLGQPAAIVSLGLAAAVLAGCVAAPAAPQSMVDQQADFNNYETFGWFNDIDAEGTREPLSLLDSAIRTAIVAELQGKGYAEAPADSAADLLIDYQAARTDTVKRRPLQIGIGIGSYGSSGGASIGTQSAATRNVTEGSILIHAIDPARGAEVWRSGVSRELRDGAASAEVVEAVIREVMHDFPSRLPAP